MTRDEFAELVDTYRDAVRDTEQCEHWEWKSSKRKERKADDDLIAAYDEMTDRKAELEAAARCAIAALSQNATFPADITLAVNTLKRAISDGDREDGDASVA